MYFSSFSLFLCKFICVSLVKLFFASCQASAGMVFHEPVARAELAVTKVALAHDAQRGRGAVRETAAVLLLALTRGGAC